MLSMPPALAHTAKSKEIKRSSRNKVSSVEGMRKRSAGCTAKSGAVETCSNRRAVDVLERKLLLGSGRPHVSDDAVQSLWDDAGNFSEPESEDEEMEVA